MSKRTIGIFFIISVLMDIVGVGMIIGGLIGSTTATTTGENSYSTQVTSFGNGPLFATGVILVSLSSIPFLIAWIGALINLARLQEWVWLVLMIIFSWITMIIYLIAGPTTRRAAQYAPYMPPQQQNYPQPPYPQQPQYNPESQQNYPQQPQYNPPPPQYNQPPQYNSESQPNNLQQPQYNPQQQQSYHQQDNPQPPENYPQT